MCRTAKWLEYNNGRMFQTTYSLIWVQWLEFVYQFTGETALTLFCRDIISYTLWYDSLCAKKRRRGTDNSSRRNGVGTCMRNEEKQRLDLR